jgi:ferritin-like protein
MNTFNEAYLNTLNDQTKKQTDRLELLIDTYKNKQDLNKQDLIELLNIAIIDEWLAEFNYFASYNLSKTEGKSDFDPEFQQHEDEERSHRKMLVDRLRELNSPVPVKALLDFQKLNSNGEKWLQEFNTDSGKILLNRYNEELNAIKYYDLILHVIHKLKEIDEFDSTTQQIIKKIKADEETHAKDLRELLVEHNLLESGEKVDQNEQI